MAREKKTDDNVERLKRDSGAGVFGGLAASITGRARPPAVAFVRRGGYLERAAAELRAFYAQRPRPWRPACNDSCRPTHKERLQAKRRAASRA